jgi:hypothetical protein
MPKKKDKLTADERAKRGKNVPLGDPGDRDTGVREDGLRISNRPGDRDESPKDPTNPASKPHGTTKDQVTEMEGEGQAQVTGQEPPPNTDNK